MTILAIGARLRQLTSRKPHTPAPTATVISRPNQLKPLQKALREIIAIGGAPRPSAMYESAKSVFYRRGTRMLDTAYAALRSCTAPVSEMTVAEQRAVDALQQIVTVATASVYHGESKKRAYYERGTQMMQIASRALDDLALIDAAQRENAA